MCIRDRFVGCEAAQRLEPSCEVVGGQKVGEMRAQLIVAVVVEALDGGFLDRAVHPLDLAVGPRMVDLGEAMLDAMGVAAHGEHVGHGSRCGPVGVAGREAELDAVVDKHGVDAIGHGGDQGIEEG